MNLVVSQEDKQIASNDQQWQTEIKKSFPWLPVITGLAIVYLGLQFLIVNPAQQELVAMQQRMQGMEKNLEQLVGVKENVWKTNDLLAAVRSQESQHQQLENALSKMKTFRIDVQAEAKRTENAMTEIRKIGQLHKEIASQNDVHKSAVKSFEQVAKLQKDLSNLRVEMKKSLEEVKDVKVMIGQLTQLKSELIADVQGLEDAQKNLKGLVALKNDVVRGAIRMKTAESSLAHMTLMQDGLVEADKQHRQAAASMKNLTRMQTELSKVDSEKIVAANKNMKQLFEMSDDLNTRSKSVEVAMETVETLADFQDDLAKRIVMIKKMRRDLLEVSLMEPTVVRIVNILKPLTQIASLRRLEKQDIQAAVKTISERRQKSNMPASIVDKKDIKKVVPNTAMQIPSKTTVTK